MERLTHIFWASKYEKKKKKHGVTLKLNSKIKINITM